ncbi:MAG: flavodoxin family protein [Coriobacteriales bacterium]|nr:flavodoxin family protein [Coriobacteriales bacterium]MBQ6586615.1 flavodoxin family protein [Coriobacteriales bacterium]
MKILVLQGSPNTNGSTALLVGEFARGAKEAGHSVEVAHVAQMDIAPCTGCVACGYGGECSQSDDFDDLRERILAADMLVFATPLYYYGMAAQLKAVVDRFCAANPYITRKRLKSALLAVAWNDDDWTFDALEAHYDTLVRYLSFADKGRVLGGGCGTPGMTKHSKHMRAAYALGRSLA